MSDFPHWARRGQRVVCVNAGDIVSGYFVHNPGGDVQVGLVYTIRALVNSKEGPCVRLKEVRRGLVFHRWKPHFDTPFFLERFRPAVEDDDHIEAAIFLAKPKHHKAPERERA